MIDGTVARRMGTTSKFGARLDTVADFVFMLVCSVKILSLVQISLWLWVWISLIALIKMCNIAWVLIREKKLISIHSVWNKITGVALFLFPLTLTFFESNYSMATICTLATIAAMQEAYRITKGQEVL